MQEGNAEPQKGQGATARMRRPRPGRKAGREARSDCFPADFIDLLREVRPTMKGEPVSVQLSLAHFVWQAPSKRRRHREFQNSFSIWHKELDQHFGRRRFGAINERVQLFEVSTAWSAKRHFTRGYRLQQDVQQAVDAYFDRTHEHLIGLITTDGLSLRKIPKAVASKNMDGVTSKAWRDAKVLNKVPVDLGALRALRAHLKRLTSDEQRLASLGEGAIDENAATVDYYLDVISRVLKLSRTTVAGEGYLMHRYVEATSGRLYARNINLQTVPRLIKQAALRGLWEYDFANCHYSIFAQIAEHAGITCPEISRYLANKHATRQDLAKRNDLSIDEAKTCLLAIMYGARASEWYQTAIPQTIGIERARRLYQDHVFKALLGELESARAAIIDWWPRRNGNYLVNDAGYGIDRRKSAKCSAPSTAR
jgi:hypothetical protein